jgi:uncharacterized membrane protein YGL010W
MSDTDTWLSDYGEQHRDIQHAALYWMSVPVLVVGIVGLLWSLPIPGEFLAISPVLNWGTAFLLATVVYYFIISIPLAIGMLPFLAGVVACQLWLETSDYQAFRAAGGLTLASLIGLYMGRHATRGIRGVWEDTQLLMIAPVWLLSQLYRKLGIPF